MSPLTEDARFAIENFDWLDPFDPHPMWRGGWMQTMSIKTMRPKLDVDNHDGCIAFDVPGDQTPPDTLSGYYLPATSKTSPESTRRGRGYESDSAGSGRSHESSHQGRVTSSTTKQHAGKPTVIILHGMGGHARSGYMRSMAERLLDAGYPVILWNHRGAGESAENCRRCHHPGYTDDLHLLTRYLEDEHRDWIQHGLAAVAFSLGANLLLEFLAEVGDRSPIDVAASVSAPLDMETTSQNLRRGSNRIFDRYLLQKQRTELLRDNVELSDEQRQAIRDASSVWELDDQFTAPHLDYDSATEFYRDNSAIYVLDKIATPTLLFHSLDDPVVDSDVFTDRDWTPGGPLYPALAQSGGHTGFLARDGSRWHEVATVRFFDTMFDQDSQKK